MLISSRTFRLLIAGVVMMAGGSLGSAGPTSAQDIQQLVVSPTQPISSRPTQIVFSGQRQCPEPPTVFSQVVQGQDLRLTVWFSDACFPGPPASQPFALAADFGLLEPGEYMLRVDIGFSDFTVPDAIVQPLTVAPSPAAIVLPEGPLFQGEPAVLQMAGVAPCPPTVTTDLGDIITFTIDGCDSGQPVTPYEIELEPIGPLIYSLYAFEVRDADAGGQLLQRGRLELLPNPPPLVFGRYTASVDWLDFDGQVGEGRSAIASSRDSALFYFFEPDNWELMLKLIDGCAINGHQWVLGAASTTVGYDITIEDRWSQQPDWTFSNALGNPSPAFIDIEAFECE